MPNDVGTIVQIIAGVLVIAVTILGVAKGGFSIFGKINKIDNDVSLNVKEIEVFNRYEEV